MSQPRGCELERKLETLVNNPVSILAHQLQQMYSRSPPHSQPGFQLPMVNHMVNHVVQSTGPPSPAPSESPRQPKVTSQCHGTPLTGMLSHRHFIILNHHKKKGEYRAARVLRERWHSFNFNFVILLQLFYFVVNLLLCRIYEITLDRKYVRTGKGMVETAFSTFCCFRHPPAGVLEQIPHG